MQDFEESLIASYQPFTSQLEIIRNDFSKIGEQNEKIRLQGDIVGVGWVQDEFENNEIGNIFEVKVIPYKKKSCKQGQENQEDEEDEDVEDEENEKDEEDEQEDEDDEQEDEEGGQESYIEDLKIALFEDIKMIDQSRIRNINEIQCVVNEINCQVCLHLVQSPVCCIVCEAIFCQFCIKTLFLKSKKMVCPCCRTDSNEYLKDDPYLKNKDGLLVTLQGKSIMTSKVPLILKKELGCNEIITYESLKKHEQFFCPENQIECSFNGCGQFIKLKEQQQHKTNCLYGEKECDYCLKQIKKIIYFDHVNICEYRKKDCNWCSVTCFLYELDEHIDKCPEREILCELCHDTIKQSLYIMHTPTICWKEKFDYEQQKNLDLQVQMSTIYEKLIQVNLENKILHLQYNQVLKAVCDKTDGLDQKSANVQNDPELLKEQITEDSTNNSKIKLEFTSLSTPLKQQDDKDSLNISQTELQTEKKQIQSPSKAEITTERKNLPNISTIPKIHKHLQFMDQTLLDFDQALSKL